MRYRLKASLSCACVNYVSADSEKKKKKCSPSLAHKASYPKMWVQYRFPSILRSVGTSILRRRVRNKAVRGSLCKIPIRPRKLPIPPAPSAFPRRTFDGSTPLLLPSTRVGYRKIPRELRITTTPISEQRKRTAVQIDSSLPDVCGGTTS